MNERARAALTLAALILIGALLWSLLSPVPEPQRQQPRTSDQHLVIEVPPPAETPVDQ